MSIAFTATTDYLTRASSIPDWNPTGNGASAGCWIKMTNPPSGAEYLPVWLFGDPALINPYVRLFIDANGLTLKIWDGVTLFTSTPVPILPDDRWLPIFLRYSTSTGKTSLQTDTTIPLYYETLDLSAITFVENEEWFASDDTGSGNIIAGLIAFQTRTGNGGGGLQFSVYFNNVYTTTMLQDFLSTAYDGAYSSEVELTTNTDLLDQTSHGNDWTSHGTPATSSVTPYNLVADGFEDNFDDGTFSPWSIGNHALLGVGTNETCAFSCTGPGGAQLTRTIINPEAAGTVNFDFALNASAFTTFEIAIFNASYIPQSTYFEASLGFGPTFTTRISQDGSITISAQPSHAAVPPITSTSAAGVFPIDGSPVGVQITWEIDGLDITIDIYVNTDLVVTLAYTYVALDFSYFNTINLYSSTTFTISNQYWDMKDNFVFTNTYNGLTPPDAPSNIANLPDEPCSVPQPDITGMSINCITKHLTVTGTGFTELDTWELQGPGAVIIDTTVISVTPTVVVLDVPDFEASGEYCLSAFNPTDCD